MNIGEAIDALLEAKRRIRNGNLRELTGLSRQAVCIALNKLVDNGELVRTTDPRR